MAARTKLTRRTVRDPLLLKAKTDSHDNTLDGLEAGTSLRMRAFTGKNGAGACTLTGALVGDIVLGVPGITTGTPDQANFESVITVNDQIQQSSASNLSANKYAVLLLTPVQ